MRTCSTGTARSCCIPKAEGRGVHDDLALLQRDSRSRLRRSRRGMRLATSSPMSNPRAKRETHNKRLTPRQSRGCASRRAGASHLESLRTAGRKRTDARGDRKDLNLSASASGSSSVRRRTSSVLSRSPSLAASILTRLTVPATVAAPPPTPLRPAAAAPPSRTPGDREDPLPRGLPSARSSFRRTPRGSVRSACRSSRPSPPITKRRSPSRPRSTR